MNINQKLPSRFDAVPEFSASVIEQLCQELSLTETEIFDIKLVLEESLTNAIKHGNHMDSDLFVEVSIVTEGRNLVITVKDQGQGFDVSRVPDPTQKEQLMKTSGRGVYLMRKLMDEVRYCDGGHTIIMTKLFNSR